MIYLEFWRRKEGLTQREAAARLGRGFSEGAISLIESGRLKPSSQQWARLKEVFGENPAWVLEPAEVEVRSCVP